MKPTHKKNMKRVRPLRKWISKAKGIRQKGGFLPLLIAGLVSLGMSAGTAASVASVAAPVIAGSLGAVGAYGANKIIKAVGGGVRPSLKIPTARRAMRIR